MALILDDPKDFSDSLDSRTVPGQKEAHIQMCCWAMGNTFSSFVSTFCWEFMVTGGQLFWGKCHWVDNTDIKLMEAQDRRLSGHKR